MLETWLTPENYGCDYNLTVSSSRESWPVFPKCSAARTPDAVFTPCAERIPYKESHEESAVPLIEVPNARFHPCMDSFVGALHGVLTAIDSERQIDELWGLSTLAFRTQIHRTLDPVGLLPRQWDETCARIFRRTGNEAMAGLRDFFYTGKDLRELQFVWMDTCEKALEDGRPAIAFGLHGPAFGIIRGLDNDTEEYHVSTFLDGQNDAPINVQDVGSQNPPLIFFIMPTGPVAEYDPHQAAMASLKEAVDHHLGQEKNSAGEPVRVPADMVSGPGAYNAWSTAVETAQVEPYWSTGYYAGYYTEARSAAAMWLRRLADSGEWTQADAFRSAASHFDHEVECFSTIPLLFPFNQPDAIQDGARRTEASACLRAARAEHIAAMEILAAAI